MPGFIFNWAFGKKEAGCPRTRECLKGNSLWVLFFILIPVISGGKFRTAKITECVRTIEGTGIRCNATCFCSFPCRRFQRSKNGCWEHTFSLETPLEETFKYDILFFFISWERHTCVQCILVKSTSTPHPKKISWTPSLPHHKKGFLKLHLFIYLMCVCGCTHVPVSLWRSKDNNFSSFHYVCPGDWTPAGHEAWQQVPLSMESSSCLPRHGFEEKQYWDRSFLLGGSKSKAHGGSGTSHEHIACYHSLTGWIVTKHHLSCWPLLTQHPSSLVIFTKSSEQLTYYQIIHLSIATSNPEDDRQAFLAYLEDLSPPLWLHWVSL